MAERHADSALLAGTAAVPFAATAPAVRAPGARWPLAVLFAVAWPAGAAALLCVLSIRRILRHGVRAAVLAIMVAAASVAGAWAVPGEFAPAMRAAALAPFTLPGVAWGLAQGGDLHVSGSMLVITNMHAGTAARPGSPLARCSSPRRARSATASSRTKLVTAPSG